MLATTVKPIRLECYLPRLSSTNNVSLFRADSLATVKTAVGLNAATRSCNVYPDKCWFAVLCRFWPQCSPILRYHKFAQSTGCPTHYRTRHFFNNSNINEDIATKQTHITDTLLFISHTTNVLLFKFRCNFFIGVRILKEMPGLVASGTPYSLYSPNSQTDVSQRRSMSTGYVSSDHEQPVQTFM
jgi:hypothetical protein